MSDEFKLPPSLDPEAISCRRGSRIQPRYDAEVRFNGVQYLIKSGLHSREQAISCASETVTLLKAAMIKAADPIILQYKAAKP